jgi:similar to stage IV sporulation protein
LGYVTFAAKDGFSERFINLCSQENILLWDIKSIKGIIYANTNIKGYKKIRKPAQKSAMKVRIHKKNGLPFIIKKYRARIGFPIGIVVLLIIIGVLSTRIWTIDVTGNESISDKQIKEVFEELGVKVGARTSKIDVTWVQEKAIGELEELSWLALNITGSNAVIEVREAIKVPQIKETSPCNIIADFGGQIKKLEVYEGTVQQKLGAAVIKGDLLISGVVENLDGSSSMKHADGLVIARTDRVIEHTQKNKIKQLTQVDEKKRYRLFFFGIDIPLFWLEKGEGYTQSYEREYRLSFADTILPVGIIKEGYRVYEEKTLELDHLFMELAALEKFSIKRRNVLDKAEILSEDIKFEDGKESITIKGKYICEENIGVKQEIFVEN